MTPLLANPVAGWVGASFGYLRNGISLRTNWYRLTRYFKNVEPAIELKDYQTDLNETKNIANKNPRIAESLMPLWENGNAGPYD